MKTVTAKELKNRTGEVLRRVRSGETMVVTLRGIPVARVVPEAPAPRRQPRVEWQARRARVREIRGKYRGLGTVAEFLKAKAQEIDLEP